MEITAKKRETIAGAIMEYIGTYKSQNRAAASLDVSPATLSSIRNGVYENISDDMWRKLASRVGLTSNTAEGVNLVQTSAVKDLMLCMEDVRAMREFVWAVSPAGSGKTSFVMQLCKELAKFERVGYNSLEEGVSLTMQNSIRRFGLTDRGSKVQFYDCETMDELSERLTKPRQPRIVVIDSFQYTQMRYKDYIEFKERHRDKLIIFISHANGSKPAGRSAVSVLYDASLKIWVQGYRAFSRGRFFGSVGHFDVWEERAKLYWRDNNKK